MADEVILLPIYPAREKPIEGISSEWLLTLLTQKEKSFCLPDEIIPALSRRRVEVLATVGAGDIDRLVHPILSSLQRKFAV
jgi:UDP-N-acetylmuramate--alanine ligase